MSVAPLPPGEARRIVALMEEAARRLGEGAERLERLGVEPAPSE